MASSGGLDIASDRHEGAIASRAEPVADVRAARRTVVTLFELAPALVLLLCSVSSDMVAMLDGDPLGIWRILPAGPVAGDWVGAEVSSTGFLLVALALLRRKRFGYWMALAVVAGGVVVQGATLGHPVSAVIALAVGLILLITRGRYDAGTGRREALLAAALLAGGVTLAGVAALAAATGADALGRTVDAIGSLLDLATPVAVPGLATIGALLVAARLAYVLASMLALDPRHDDRSPAEVAAAKATLRRVGGGALFPYQLGPECTAWHDEAATAALAVAPVGRIDLALGDPAGEPAAASSVLDAWIMRCRRDDLAPVVYRASAELATRLRRRGWVSIPVGRLAIVDPVSFDLSSPRVVDLRQALARANERGITTMWSLEGLAAIDDARVTTAIPQLNRAWRGRAGTPSGLASGRFEPDLDAGDARAAIAIARDADGLPVAFAVLRPTGSDGGWVLDVARQPRPATPGALEACLVTAITALGEVGVQRLALGLAPLGGLDSRSPRRSERWLARGARRIRPLYDHERRATFKEQFGPVWESRFLLVENWASLSAALIALLRLRLGGGWGRVVRSVAGVLIPAR